MPKLFTRIVALLLVSCLVADPALAMSLKNSLAPVGKRIKGDDSDLFAKQALAGVIVSEINPSISSRDKLKVIGWWAPATLMPTLFSRWALAASASFFLVLQACVSNNHVQPQPPLSPSPPGLLMTSAQDLAQPLSEEIKIQLLVRLEPKLRRYDQLYFSEWSSTGEESRYFEAGKSRLDASSRRSPRDNPTIHFGVMSSIVLNVLKSGRKTINCFCRPISNLNMIPNPRIRLHRLRFP